MHPLFYLLTGWVLTSLWPIIAKDGIQLFSGVLFLHAGLVLGLLALSPWLVSNGRWRRLFSPELLRPLFIMGLFGSGLGSFFMITALQYTTSANAAIMAQVEVLYSAVLCAWLLKERISVRQILGGFLVVAGTGLILFRDFSSAQWKGDLLVLATPWMFQVSHIYAKRLPQDMDAFAISGARVLYAAIILIPFSLAVLLAEPRWSWGFSGIRLLLIQGIGMCAVSMVLWYLAIRRMELAKATTIMLSYPALTVFFSWLLGRETIHAAQITGLILTLSGAYWVSLLAVKSHGPKLGLDKKPIPVILKSAKLDTRNGKLRAIGGRKAKTRGFPGV